MSDQPAPIIIKRKKIIAGGHHGGAWKVAYADFVTAMMAFFLLMWLLGATTEKQRKGIADYFNPTVPINKSSGGGDGAFSGDSIFSENTLAQNGVGAGMTVQSVPTEAGGKNGVDPDDDGDTAAGKDPMEEMANELAEKLTGKSGESMVSDLLRRHIVTRLTDEGLVVEVFDLPDAPLFDDGAEPSDALRSVTIAIAEVFRLATNEIAVQGHTATVPLAARDNRVWALSSERADAARRLLLEYGIDDDRLQRVSGFADRKPVADDKLSTRNNRLEFILLRSRF
ncbi:MAG: flagellar motor protein MotB [Pseudomonadota bacterium]